MAENPVKIEKVDQEVQGQAQGAGRQPHDGKVTVRETRVVTDRIIKDPKDPLAVQVPEGTGASWKDDSDQMRDRFEGGLVEDVFGRAEAEPAPAEPAAGRRGKSDGK